MEKPEKPAAADARESHTETPASSPRGMASLPDELLPLIFQNLDLSSKGRVCQVSRTWKKEGYRPFVWRDECFTLSRSTVWTPGLVDSLRTRRIRTVVIKSGANLTHAKELLQGLTSLKQVEIERTDSMSREDLLELKAQVGAKVNVTVT